MKLTSNKVLPGYYLVLHRGTAGQKWQPIISQPKLQRQRTRQMENSFQWMNGYTGLVSLDKSWLRQQMTEVYEVWTGIEQVHKEQLSIFSSNTRTSEHPMKVLGRVYEQEKGKVFPQNTVVEFIVKDILPEINWNGSSYIKTWMNIIMGHKTLLTHESSWEAEATSNGEAIPGHTITQLLGFSSSSWADACQSQVICAHQTLDWPTRVVPTLFCIWWHLHA